jgi:hemoglobin/transferrin/lactoferrin receptor protein
MRFAGVILFFIVFSFQWSVLAQTINALVQNENEEPLPGVHIISSTGNHLDVTDENGRCILNVDETYSFTFLGYETIKLNTSQIISNNHVVSLYPSQELLEEIVVLGRTEVRYDHIPHQVETIRKEKLVQGNIQTTVDALEKHSSAYTQKSQMGGGSPILRGFEANKLLLVIDGIRMNNAIYRSGHLHNAISVDENSLEKIEVLFGPASLMYGSDALGGVIHFRLPKPEYSQNGRAISSVNALGKYATANNGVSLNLGVSNSGKRLASVFNISGSSFSDLRSGSRRPDKYPDFGKRLFYADREGDEDILVENDDENIQRKSSYKQLDLSHKLGIQLAKGDLEFLTLFSTSSDIPRYDQLHLPGDEPGSLEYAEWYYGPQKWFLQSAALELSPGIGIADKFRVSAAFQSLSESRHSRLFGSDLRGNNIEDIKVFQLNADLEKMLDPSGNHKLVYGASYIFNDVNSTASLEDISTGEKNDEIFTRYPSGGSSMHDAGLFALYKWQVIKDKLITNVGLRYAIHELKVNYKVDDLFNWPEHFYDGLSVSDQAITWSAGMNYKPNKTWLLRLNTGTAFRSPNVDDFAKVRVKSDKISIPNENLGKETAFSIEAAIQKSIKFGSNQNVKLGVVGYYNLLKDIMVRADFALPGGDSVFVSADRAYKVQANVNREEGYIRGLSGFIELKPAKSWKLVTKINVLEGYQINSGNKGKPLAHIPPVFGYTELSWSPHDFTFSAAVRYNGKKSLDKYAPASADNEEYATPEGTLAWTTYHLSAGYKINDKVYAGVALDNLTDLHYRKFSSGISEAGFNATLTLKAGF